MSTDIINIKPKKSKINSSDKQNQYNITTNHVDKKDSLDKDSDYLNINSEFSKKNIKNLGSDKRLKENLAEDDSDNRIKNEDDDFKSENKIDRNEIDPSSSRRNKENSYTSKEKINEDESFDKKSQNDNDNKSKEESMIENQNFSKSRISANENEVVEEKTLKQKINNILDSFTYTIIMTALTVFVLFADDIKNLSTDKYADDPFSIVTAILFGYFFIEFVVQCIVIDEYVWSFFFYLDFLSTISMILDLSWFYAFLISSISGDTTDTKNGSKIKNLVSIAKASRAARIGSRAVRILRVLRIIRLVRISKIYKASSKLGNEMEAIEDKLNKKMHKKKDAENSESKIGKKLSDLTTKRVVVLILSMILSVIVFDSGFYFNPENSMYFGMKIFNEFTNFDDGALNLTFNIYVNEHLNISTPIIYAEVNNLTYGSNNYDFLRYDEKLEVIESCINFLSFNETSNCYALFDNRKVFQLNSLLNIIKTIIICIILIGANIMFSNDTNELVLEPIENMIKKIKNISNDPISAIEKNEEIDYQKDMLDKEDNKNCCSKSVNKESLETFLLNKTLTKIGTLLALGYGEAGSKIIIKNMNNENNENNDEENDENLINPMVSGNKVMAIYGFCDIRNFTDTTEVLEEDIMLFVNEIAEIVHNITHENFGFANKNIGDAFLLVWKFEDQHIEYDENMDIIGLKQCKQVSELVDSSVIAFIKILAKIQKSYQLNKYRNNDKLRNRISNYSVKLGFGLHLGWSIEGAIGSVYKIDASYLSQHVNGASKLEEKTKEYGCHIIISDDIAKHMSENARNNLRIIDVINLIDEEETKIYTIDLDINALSIEEEDYNEYQDFDLKLEKRYKKKKLLLDILNNKSNVWENYENTDNDYHIMRNKFSQNFFDLYNKGFEAYIKGNWKDAKSFLEACNNELDTPDRPATRILSIMSKHMFVMPEGWKFTEVE